jgi:hypothetical protein
MSTLKSINVIHPSSATNNIVNDASGNVAVGNNLTVAGTATIAGVAAVAVAPSTAGNVLTSTGSAWASTAPSSIVPTPSAIGQIPFSTDGSTYTATQKITQGTAVTLTSQTSVDFTSIPSWVKRVTIMLANVSTNGSSPVQIQIGSGSISTSGYVGAETEFANGGVAGVALLSAGFQLDVGGLSASTVRIGQYILSSAGANFYTLTGAYGRSDTTRSTFTSGGISLAGTLDRIRLTTVNGTDTFDAGVVNILYE